MCTPPRSIARLLLMNTAKLTGAASPTVSVVGEGRVNLRAEVVVVTKPLIAEALAVDREVAVELSKEYSPDEPVGVSEIVVPLMT